jgi:hypothetical protein
MMQRSKRRFVMRHHHAWDGGRASFEARLRRAPQDEERGVCQQMRPAAVLALFF